jgi:O-acetyl-ADP-ribose deacetylase (regulator of RNase III)
MTSRMFRGDAHHRSRGGRDEFDPVAEGARHRLDPAAAQAIWDRVCGAATDREGRRDEARARQEFHAVATGIAERGGRPLPGPGKLTRDEAEAAGADPRSDGFAARGPGKTTQILVETQRWDQRARDLAPEPHDRAAAARSGSFEDAARQATRVPAAMPLAALFMPQAAPWMQSPSRQAAIQARMRRAGGGGALGDDPAAPPPSGGERLPAALRAGIRALSGVDVSDVWVHRDSTRPDSIGAEAYAQARHIYLGRGHDHHLPHEAWHVAQQQQGRVAATAHRSGVGLNDDDALEREADDMGARAAGFTGDVEPAHRPAAAASPRIGDGGAAPGPIAQGKFSDKDGVWIDEDTGEAYDLVTHTGEVIGFRRRRDGFGVMVQIKDMEPRDADDLHRRARLDKATRYQDILGDYEQRAADLDKEDDKPPVFEKIAAPVDAPTFLRTRKVGKKEEHEKKQSQFTAQVVVRARIDEAPHDGMFSAAELEALEVRVSDERPPTRFKHQKSHTTAWVLIRTALASFEGRPLDELLDFLTHGVLELMSGAERHRSYKDLANHKERKAAKATAAEGSDEAMEGVELGSPSVVATDDAMVASDDEPELDDAELDTASSEADDSEEDSEDEDALREDERAEPAEALAKRLVPEVGFLQQLAKGRLPLETWTHIASQLMRGYEVAHHKSRAAAISKGKANNRGEQDAMARLPAIEALLRADDKAVASELYEKTYKGTPRKYRSGKWQPAKLAPTPVSDVLKLIDLAFSLSLPVPQYARAMRHWFQLLHIAFPKIMAQQAAAVAAAILDVDLPPGVAATSKCKTRRDLFGDLTATNFSVPKKMPEPEHDLGGMDETSLACLVRLNPLQEASDDGTTIRTTAQTFTIDELTIGHIALGEKRPDTRFGVKQWSHTVAWTLVRASVQAFSGQPFANLYAYLHHEIHELIDGLESDAAYDARWARDALDAMRGARQALPEWQRYASNGVVELLRLYQLSRSATYLKDPGGRAEGFAMQVLRENEQHLAQYGGLHDDKSYVVKNALGLIDVDFHNDLSWKSFAHSVLHWEQHLTCAFPTLMAVGGDQIVAPIHDRRLDRSKKGWNTLPLQGADAKAIQTVGDLVRHFLASTGGFHPMARERLTTAAKSSATGDNQQFRVHDSVGTQDSALHAFALGLVGLVAQGALAADAVFGKLGELPRDVWTELCAMAARIHNPANARGIQVTLAPLLRRLAADELERSPALLGPVVERCLAQMPALLAAADEAAKQPKQDPSHGKPDVEQADKAGGDKSSDDSIGGDKSDDDSIEIDDPPKKSHELPPPDPIAGAGSELGDGLVALARTLATELPIDAMDRDDAVRARVTDWARGEGARLYLQRLRQPGSPTGHTELLALAQRFGAQLATFTGDGDAAGVEDGPAHARPVAILVTWTDASVSGPSDGTAFTEAELGLLLTANLITAMPDKAAPELAFPRLPRSDAHDAVTRLDGGKLAERYLGLFDGARVPVIGVRAADERWGAVTTGRGAFDVRSKDDLDPARPDYGVWRSELPDGVERRMASGHGGARRTVEGYVQHAGTRRVAWVTTGNDNCAFNGMALVVMGLVAQGRMTLEQLAGPLNKAPEELAPLVEHAKQAQLDPAAARAIEDALEPTLRDLACNELEHRADLKEQMARQVLDEIHLRVYRQLGIPWPGESDLVPASSPLLPYIEALATRGNNHVLVDEKMMLALDDILSGNDPGNHDGDSDDLYEDEEDEALRALMKSTSTRRDLGPRAMEDDAEARPEPKTEPKPEADATPEPMHQASATPEPMHQTSATPEPKPEPDGKPDAKAEAEAKRRAEERAVQTKARREAADRWILTQEETVHTWFARDGIKLYLGDMRKERVWGGGPELFALAQALGVQLTIFKGLGNGAAMADPGFGTAGTAPADGFSLDEIATLRGADVIEGVEIDPKKPQVVFKRLTREQVEHLLAAGKVADDLARRFLALHAQHYRFKDKAPVEVGMYRHRRAHWSAMTSAQGAYDLADAKDYVEGAPLPDRMADSDAVAELSWSMQLMGGRGSGSLGVAFRRLQLGVDDVETVYADHVEQPSDAGPAEPGPDAGEAATTKADEPPKGAAAGAVAPKLSDAKLVEQLRQAVRAALDEAQANDLKEIRFGNLGAEAFGGDPQRSATIIQREVEVALQTPPESWGTWRPTRIVFNNFPLDLDERGRGRSIPDGIQPIEGSFRHAGARRVVWVTAGDDNCAFNSIALVLMGLVAQGRLKAGDVAGPLKLDAHAMAPLVADAHKMATSAAAARRIELALEHKLRLLAAATLGTRKDLQGAMAEHFEDEVRGRICRKLKVPWNGGSDLVPSDSPLMPKIDELQTAAVAEIEREKDFDTKGAKERERAIDAWMTNHDGELIAWFLDVGITKYLNDMRRDHVWGGAVELHALAPLFGVQLTTFMGLGSGVVAADPGAGTAGTADAGDLTNIEISALASAGVIEGKPLDPAHREIVFVRMSRDEAGAKLAKARVSKSATDKFFLRYDKDYKFKDHAPIEIGMYRHSQRSHWSAVSSAQGAYDLNDPIDHTGGFGTHDDLVDMVSWSSAVNKGSKGTAGASASAGELTVTFGRNDLGVKGVQTIYADHKFGHDNHGQDLGRFDLKKIDPKIDGSKDRVGLVNAANERLRGGGGIDGAIKEHEGHDDTGTGRHWRDIEVDALESKRKTRSAGINVGEAATTPGGKMQGMGVSGVIHTVGPRLGDVGPEKVLKQCVRSVMLEAVANKLDVIIFCNVSSELFGVAQAICANAIFDEIQLLLHAPPPEWGGWMPTKIVLNNFPQKLPDQDGKRDDKGDDDPGDDYDDYDEYDEYDEYDDDHHGGGPDGDGGAPKDDPGARSTPPKDNKRKRGNERPGHGALDSDEHKTGDKEQPSNSKRQRGHTGPLKSAPTGVTGVDQGDNRKRKRE